MLSQFKKKLKFGEKKSATNNEEQKPKLVSVTPHRLDEEAIRKNIENKLKRYRPLQRDASFTGPKYN